MSWHQIDYFAMSIEQSHYNMVSLKIQFVSMDPKDSVIMRLPVHSVILVLS